MAFKTTKSALAVAIIVSSSSAAAVTVNLEKGTQLEVYGSVKLDLIYDVDDKMGPLVNYGAITLDGEDAPDGFADLHVYQSNLGFKTTTPTSFGNIETVIEGEFFGGGGGEFLLNHAYVKTDNLLAGQFWSNFSNFIAKTPTIDFLGGVGQTVLDQQPQLRYTKGGFSAAVEKPGNLGGQSRIFFDTNLDATPDFIEEKNVFPDLTLQYQSRMDRFTYGLSGVIRSVEFFNDATSSEERSVGYGLALSGKFQLTNDLSIQGGYVAGDGIGTYLYGNPVPVAFYDPIDNDVETIKAQGATLGMSYNGLTLGQVNIAFGMVKGDLDDAEDAGLDVDSEMEEIQSIYVNYLWSDDYGIQYGVEVGNHRKQLVDGREGDATRVQAMVKYGF